VAAGLVGTTALSLVETLERRVLGRDPVYAAPRIAARLARGFGFAIDARHARALGSLLRWSYGPALGLMRGWLGTSRRRSLWDAIPYGAGIYLFEILALPGIGATPPLRRWRRAEVLLLATHTMAFAWAAELTR
jgi:hypothetical protein